ncbi:MAG TPA: hypothetical protein VHK06_04180 [Candidatus Limnocylindria bacterium]|nr:hypothetical protein [Candidatus Limnocylindria bacterium]
MIATGEGDGSSGEAAATDGAGVRRSSDAGDGGVLWVGRGKIDGSPDSNDGGDPAPPQAVTTAVSHTSATRAR